ncbi:hypothetical protein ELH91_04335 [Rhizobium leguminosarum]|nr:hypothetical protein ELH91_04335 [Rhizobium leguminosarum]
MPRNPSTGFYSKPAGTTPSVGQVIDPEPGISGPAGDDEPSPRTACGTGRRESGCTRTGSVACSEAAKIAVVAGELSAQIVPQNGNP